MSQDEEIDLIIADSIKIIELEVYKIKCKQQTEDNLGREDTDRIIDFLKTLVIVQKDKRLGSRYEDKDIGDLSPSEIEAAIQREVEKLAK